jgi:hypothetical protein
MKVVVNSILPCPPQRTWETVKTSALLQEVARPLVYLHGTATEGFPSQWEEGEVVMCKLRLFGFLPFPTHAMTMERIDDQRREIQSREHDALIRKWDHLIRVEETADGQTRYTDEIDIDAGWLTFPVWLFAQWFYRHRQKRWQRVARRLAARDVSCATPKN